MKLRRWLPVISAFVLVLSACTTDADLGAAGAEATDPSSAARDTDSVSEGPDLEFILPALPSIEELAKPFPVGVPGVTIAPEAFGSDFWVWCDALDLNPNEDAPDADGIHMYFGPEKSAEGVAFVFFTFDAAKFNAGDVVTFPSESWDFVFFMANLHDDAQVPQDYNSDQEESSGSLTLHQVPCQGEGDVLSFTVDGGLGAETNPGYKAAATVQGTFSGTVSEAPPGF